MEKDNGLLTIKNLIKHFDISGGLLDQLRFSKGKISRERTVVKAVNDVSFSIKPGETLSVVGESGCGKSTLARTVLGLYPPNSGEIYYHGDRIDNLSSKEMLPFRTKMQMIFQDPYASHRPWKMQPGGRLIGVGTSPFNLICFGFFSPSIGIALKSAFVYGCRCDSNSSLTVASSHNVPRYITATLVLICFTTDRSWVIKR